MTQTAEEVSAPGAASGSQAPLTRDTRAWRWILIVVLALGVFFRVRQYLARESFWNDEAFVVLNVMDHSFKRLMGPLDFQQAAPPVFLWIERSAGRTLGWGEFSLRLFPLLAGLASLGLFAVLARRLMPLPLAAFATGYFALNDKLIGYCSEVKQYSSDALLAVLLMLIVLGPRRSWSATKRFTILACCAAAAVWLSHPSIIVFAALSLLLLPGCFRAGARGRVAWVGGNALVLASLAALYVLSIRFEHDPFLYVFWAPGFPPLRHPLGIPLWFVGRLSELAKQPFRAIWGLVAIVEALGALWLFQRDRQLLWACVGPMVLTMAAAFAHQYPFSPSRLTLFMMPGMLILCAAAGGLLVERLKGSAARLWIVLPGIVLIYGTSAAIGRAIHPIFRSHIRPVVEYVRAHRQPGDALILTGEPLPGVPKDEPTRHREFLCYWRHPDPPVYLTFPPPGGIPAGRFWIVYPFSPRKSKTFIRPVLEQARAVARQEGKPFVVKQGGAAYLFIRR